MVRFENIKIIKFRIPFCHQKLTFCLPGIGIFIHPEDVENKQLLAHEFGHILQARKWGYWNFYFRIAPISLLSSMKHGKNNFNHFNTWTEWSANLLAKKYLPEVEWDQKKYFTHPLTKNAFSEMPENLQL